MKYPRSFETAFSNKEQDSGGGYSPPPWQDRRSISGRCPIEIDRIVPISRVSGWLSWLAKWVESLAHGIADCRCQILRMPHTIVCTYRARVSLDHRSTRDPLSFGIRCNTPSGIHCSWLTFYTYMVHDIYVYIYTYASCDFRGHFAKRCGLNGPSELWTRIHRGHFAVDALISRIYSSLCNTDLSRRERGVGYGIIILFEERGDRKFIYRGTCICACV